MTTRPLSPIVARAADSIIRRRFDECTTRDLVSGPLTRAIRLVEFAHQAVSNAEFRGDELSMDALYGVFATISYELQDLAAMLEHVSLEVEQEPRLSVVERQGGAA